MPKTFAGLLRAALGPDTWPKAGTIYRHGDESWFSKLPPRTAIAAPPAGPPPQISFVPPPAQRDRGLERTSPSALEGGHHTSAQQLLGLRTQSFEHGTLIHAWLEDIAWLDDGLPTGEQFQAIAVREAPGIAANPADLARRLAEFRQQLAAPTVAAALSKTAYARHGASDLVVQTERAFAIRDGEQILSGSIDRVVLVRAGGKLVAAEVLDFKTDVFDASDDALLAGKIEFYRPQIAAYQRAVAKLTGLPESQITARLVFLTAGKVCEL